MPALEAAAAAAAKAVAQRAAQEWLSVRSAQTERNSDLATLIRSELPDRLVRRSFQRQVEAIADGVDRRLMTLVEREYGGLSESDRAAALLEAVDTLKRADFSDRAVFDAAADPILLTRRIRQGLADPRPQLGEAGGQLYDVLLEECVECVVRILQQLPQYLPRVATELLGRTARLGEQLDELGRQVSTVLAKLPARTLDAPSGVQDDAEFERRYLEHISRTLDEVELFGVRVDNYRPRATLSIAYISLSVSAESRRPDHERMRFGDLTDAPAQHGMTTVRAESALGRASRTLLRGDAGSGKSTLLRWLSVTAARGGFVDELAGWNGCVPFVVKLRSHHTGVLPGPESFIADVAGPLAGRMPTGWAHRILESGRALLLVDGVDELAVRHRPAVRQWLGGLMSAYPDIRTVVTSRPAAADARWLEEEGFESVMLEPMTPHDLHELVRHWHLAMKGSKSLPCTSSKLEEYQGALLARLESGRHLQVLASTPLLAAMLCALNLDRGTQLPRNRMGLYAAALELLLVRRDVERGIAAEVTLEPEQTIRILQDLAWQLSVWGRSELSKATALRRIADKVASMPRIDATAEAVLDHLIQRSGVIREPATGRIDFVHRTVQEYLAAKQAADDADVEPLVERAHLDQWRETVVMAAGHANAPVRRELLAGLLDRAERDRRYARRLRLLVAGCLETVQELPADLRERIDACLAEVIPPRNDAEARSLALAGEEALRRLPEGLRGLSTAKAVATVRTCWLINGPEALVKLTGYAGDTRGDVKRELITGWSYFDPDTYAAKILAEVTPPNRRLDIDNPRLLGGLGRLRKIDAIDVNCPVDRLDFLRTAPPLSWLALQEMGGASLEDLACHPELDWLWIHFSPARQVDLKVLSRLPELRKLKLSGVDFTDLGFLDTVTSLDSLLLGDMNRVRDFTPITRHAGLQSLALYRAHLPRDPAFFASFPKLDHVSLQDSMVDGGLPALVRAVPGLAWLMLRHCDWVNDLSPLSDRRLSELNLQGCRNVKDLTPLAGQQSLHTLSLQYTAVTDLGPLSGLPCLRYLNLYGCSGINDLAPLSSLPALKSVILSSTAQALDLSPLADMRNLAVFVDKTQKIRNARTLHRSINVIRS
ncbi:NACHT domain-containing protein [Streptosporangium sp. NPDC000396]|uniref:NACHT N-terminal Helical domain 1-containing protein n=1 Tax=Streptosporangium sp. NPDC000396 TaxID=3366185 RepID=UPI0036842E66